MQLRALVLLAALLAPGLVQAQPLADRVPADALVYVGWSGAQGMGPAYAQSRLKAVLDASSLPQFLQEALPRAMKRLGQEDPDAGKVMEIVGPIVSAVWKHPTAFYFGGVDLSKRAPMPRLAILCRAGADAPGVLAQLTKALAEVENDLPVPIAAKGLGDVVALTIGELPPASLALFGGAKGVGAGAPLADSAAFKQAQAQVQADASAMVYVDAEGLLKLVDQVVAMQAEQVAQFDPQAAGPFLMWPQMRDALGLTGVKRIAWTGGFAGRDWASRLFVAAPAPRVGLLAMLQSKPLSNEALAVIPRSATIAGAGRFDLARLLTEIRTALGKIDPNMQEAYDQAMEQASATIGMDVKDDVLAALGDEWAYYADPGVGGQGMTAMVLVNHLRQPAKLAAATSALESLVNKMMAEQGDEDIHIAIKTVQVGDLSIHYLSIPAIAPAWAIMNGNLYVGMYPQVVAAAAEHVSSGGPSILLNPDFAALRQRLGGDKASGFQFVDLPRTAPGGYPMLLMLSQLATGLVDMSGADAPAMVVPPLYKLRPHLFGSGGFTWTDDAGFHASSIRPFPGAMVLGVQDSSMASQTALMAGILLPALGAARTTARAMQSLTQLRGIHQGCVLWSQGQNGKFPPDIATMYHGQFFTVDYVIAPTAGVKVPPQFMQWTKEQQSEWINTNTSYCYITGRIEDTDSEKIVLFERLPNSRGVVNMVFNDNHAVAVPIQDAARMIKEQTGHTLEQWQRVKQPGAGWKDPGPAGPPF